MTIQETAPLPHHLEDTVATIAAFHAAHNREAHALQKAVARATGGIARPVTLILITVAIAGWVMLNLALPGFGHAALDPFPFPLLSAAVSTVGLYLAAMILITQRHDDEMAKGVPLRILGMGLDTATANGRLMLKVLGSVAQFERKVMLERPCVGIAKAKGEGKYKGRAPTARAKSDDVRRLAVAGATRESIGA